MTTNALPVDLHVQLQMQYSGQLTHTSRRDGDHVFYYLAQG